MSSTFAWHYYEKQKSSSCVLKKKKPYNFSLIQIRTSRVKRQKQDLKRVQRDQKKVGRSQGDAMQIDSAIGFENVGGLSEHIAALKEMVIFPLLYPEVFQRFNIQPPRGCLFYGPPGTGKTLVARALASEYSRSDRKISFFMRNASDCMRKYVGESERQLRVLFEQAYQMRPSIIFFDEIDGLAPVRSSKQDHIHRITEFLGWKRPQDHRVQPLT
ncbi:ATPase family AAA domain-containing protein 2-like isoform X1 [Anas acuta]|uniref:ATPase family AAA domain-containing protein 2-like isoform X1 n=1 Tax=Anas acuta TaxID=28680 RepID=UPI0035C8DCF6